MNISAVCVLVATLTIFTAGITSEVSAVGFTITCLLYTSDAADE